MARTAQPNSPFLSSQFGRKSKRASRTRAKTDPLASRSRVDVAKIWNELAAFDAATSDAALDYLLRTIAQLIEADGCLWVGAARVGHGVAARRDAQRGWRGLAMHLPGTGSLIPEKLAQQAWRAQDGPMISMTSAAVAAAAGKFRGIRLRQLVNMAAFRRTEHYKLYYAGPGVDDRMWISFPVSPEAESHFVFDRARPHRRFTRREMDRAAGVLEGLRWFHRQVMLNHGLLLANGPLSPMQRRVLALLLSERSEKEIAHHLGQSVHTTHTHVREIFRRFGVSGRAALMAIWLRGS